MLAAFAYVTLLNSRTILNFKLRTYFDTSSTKFRNYYALYISFIVLLYLYYVSRLDYPQHPLNK